jgi:hypothetical protein
MLPVQPRVATLGIFGRAKPPPLTLWGRIKLAATSYTVPERIVLVGGTLVLLYLVVIPAVKRLRQDPRAKSESTFSAAPTPAAKNELDGLAILHELTGEQ